MQWRHIAVNKQLQQTFCHRNQLIASGLHLTFVPLPSRRMNICVAFLITPESFLQRWSVFWTLGGLEVMCFPASGLWSRRKYKFALLTSTNPVVSEGFSFLAVNCCGTEFTCQCISLLMMCLERWWIFLLLIHLKITCHYFSTKKSGDDEGSPIRKWISDEKRLPMKILRLRFFAFPLHDTSSMQFVDGFFFCFSFWRVTFCSAWLTNEVSLKGSFPLKLIQQCNSIQPSLIPSFSDRE